MSEIDENVLDRVKHSLRGFLKIRKGTLPHGSEILRNLDYALDGITVPLRKDCINWVKLRQKHSPGIKLYAINSFLNDESIFGDRVNNEYGDEVYVDSCILYIYLKYFDEVKKEARFKLYDSIYKTYAAGAWPCGWVGNYPDGHILVYWPFKEEPTFEDAPKKSK